MNINFEIEDTGSWTEKDFVISGNLDDINYIDNQIISLIER